MKPERSFPMPETRWKRRAPDLSVPESERCPSCGQRETYDCGDIIEGRFRFVCDGLVPA